MPDELARKVRMMAAGAEMSMSRFLCRLAEEKARVEDQYEAAKREYFGRKSRPLRDPGRPLPSREERYDRAAFC